MVNAKRLHISKIHLPRIRAVKYKKGTAGLKFKQRKRWN
jgi:hypothetical protein